MFLSSIKDGYALKDIRFEWSQTSNEPVTISNKLEMPDFILTSYNATVCQRKTSTGWWLREAFYFICARDTAVSKDFSTDKMIFYTLYSKVCVVIFICRSCFVCVWVCVSVVFNCPQRFILKNLKNTNRRLRMSRSENRASTRSF
jgi:hypothetical protein